MQRWQTFALVSWCAVAVTLSGSARAQDPERNAAAAETAFQRAIELMKGGDNAAACPLLEESQRLDPGVGVLMYLGECYERVGRLASAWATFRQAAAAAKLAGQQDRVQKADQRAAALESRTPKLTVHVPAASRIPGQEVLRDGTVLGESLWNTPIPVDPGPHTIVVRAIGYEPYKQTVPTREGATAVVQIPALRRAALGGSAVVALTPDLPLPPPVAPPAASSPWSEARIAGVVIGAAGLAGLTLGAGFGIATITTWGEASGGCSATGDPVVCDPDSVRLVDAARTYGWASTGLFVAGGVLTATGVILAIAAPNAETVSVQALPGGFRALGTF